MHRVNLFVSLFFSLLLWGFLLSVVVAFAGCVGNKVGGSSSGDRSTTATAEDDGRIQISDASGDEAVATTTDDNRVDNSGSAAGGDLVEDIKQCINKFLWKPRDEDGADMLAVLFPKPCPVFVKACVFDFDTEQEVCVEPFGPADANGRLKFLFPKPGENYYNPSKPGTPGALLIAETVEGIQYEFEVPDASQRNDLQSDSVELLEDEETEEESDEIPE